MKKYANKQYVEQEKKWQLFQKSLKYLTVLQTTKMGHFVLSMLFTHEILHIYPNIMLSSLNNKTIVCNPYLKVTKEYNSQFPLVDGDSRVGVCVAGQLHILSIQIPVPVKPLNLHLWFICSNQKKKSSGRISDGFPLSRDFTTGACHKND